MKDDTKFKLLMTFYAVVLILWSTSVALTLLPNN